MNAFKAEFPTICELLSSREFDEGIEVANSLSQTELWQAIDSGAYELNELMGLLYGVVYPDWWKVDAVELECNLAVVVSEVGVDVARSAFKKQFLVESAMKSADVAKNRKVARDQLEDVRYEVAVTAKACQVLDNGSIQLERPIPDRSKPERDWKNSDLYGTVNGQPVRIEVTVLHEELPPSISVEVDDIISDANIDSGFGVSLGLTVSNPEEAERVKAVIELLHESHKKTGGADFQIDGVKLEWDGNVYRSSATSPVIEDICFYDPSEIPDAESIREITHSCIVRNLTPAYVIEEYPSPPGVVTSADLPDAPKDVPLSSKIRTAIERKLDQCESGMINIVAFGNPSPMNDIDIDNALRGTAFAAVPFWTDKRRVRHSGDAVPMRAPKAPFVPEQALASDDDREQFIDAFRKLSAVWNIRLGSSSTSKMIRNPNATNPVPDELFHAFSDEQPSTDSQANRLGPPLTSHDKVGDSEEVVWEKIAQNFVGVCGSFEEARCVLSVLAGCGQPIDELQKRVDTFFEEGPKTENSKVFTMTNEEAAMYFVIDCGGYEQATACLDAFAKESVNGDSEGKSKT